MTRGNALPLLKEAGHELLPQVTAPQVRSDRRLLIPTISNRRIGIGREMQLILPHPQPHATYISTTIAPPPPQSRQCARVMSKTHVGDDEATGLLNSSPRRGQITSTVGVFMGIDSLGPRLLLVCESQVVQAIPRLFDTSTRIRINY